MAEPHSPSQSRPLTPPRGRSGQPGYGTQLSSNYGNTDNDAVDDGKPDLEVENNKFAFSPDQLDKLFNPKNFGAFDTYGGLRGLEKGLRTNV
jgi:Ca2+-transporting ATPase